MLKRKSPGECKHCRGITLESLSSVNGYRHAPSRSSLVRSAQKCGFCSLLFRKDRSSRHSSGQIVLSLELFNEDDSVICLRVRHDGEQAREDAQSLVFFPYTHPEDPSVAYGITVKRALSHTASDETFRIVGNWLNHCIENHDCSTRLPLKERDNTLHLLPSRFLDLEAFPSSADIKLVESGDVDKDAKYITLSYCWGKSRTFTTTSRSLRLRKSRIQFSSLPKTFQDAVRISRKLCVRYLWIDALCIVQDERKDWERESSKMGAIYSRAYFTIAADSGVDCNSGCFNSHSTGQELAYAHTPFELRISMLDGVESSIFLWDPSRGVRIPSPPEIDDSPLSSRGWCCQERILSPRILHYTRTQLFWECRQVLLAEDNLRPWTLFSNQAGTVCGLARNLYGRTQDPTSLRTLLNVWYSNVVAQSYSQRKLTLPEDKLVAISGIARAFHRHFQSTYIAGLWRLDLAWGLSWRRRGFAVRPEQYRAPSFSWASMDTIVDWPAQSLSRESRMEVKEICMNLGGEDPFGRVSRGFISVNGEIRQALVMVTRRMSAGRYDHVWELRSTENDWLGTAFMDDEPKGEEPRIVECLTLSQDTESGCVELLLLASRGSQSGEYERIGVAETLGLDTEEKFHSHDTRTEVRIY